MGKLPFALKLEPSYHKVKYNVDTESIRVLLLISYDLHIVFFPHKAASVLRLQSSSVLSASVADSVYYKLKRASSESMVIRLPYACN